MKDKALKLLGLMRRANAIQIGEEKTGATARNGKAVLVLTAEDASENAQHRAEGFAAGRTMSPVRLPFTKAEISEAVGVNGCSMAAVTDLGFADAIMRILAEDMPEEYSDIADRVSERLKASRPSKRPAKGGKQKKKLRED